MTVFAKKSSRHAPLKFNEEAIQPGTMSTLCGAGNTYIQTQAKRYEFMNELESLGGEAKTIARILLDSPAEILGIALDSSACSIRVAIKKHMKELGFTNKSILLGISEIKGLVS